MLFRNRTLSSLNWKEIFLKYGEKLASLSNPKQVYGTLLKTLAEIAQTPNASLLLLDDPPHQFILKEALGVAPFAYTMPLNHPLVIWLSQDRKVLSREQLMNDPQFFDLKSASLRYFTEWKVDLAFPLRTERKFLGLFNLGMRSGEKSYRAEEIELFSSLLNLGSVFIENSNLYDTLIKQNVKLTELSRLKTQFISNITHELYTPLHGILGLNDLLLEDPEQALPEDYRRYLEMMKRSGESLLEMIDQVLLLTKYQTGMLHLSVRKLKLKRLLFEIMEKIEENFQEKGLQFYLDWPDSTPDIYGDESELKILLRALLGNAFKFTPSGKIEVSATKLGEMLRICIADTGVGIEPEMQESIFEDFRQLDASPERMFEGSGIGLSVAAKIVELHGGRIWVESKKGEGSKFYFTLPLSPGQIGIQTS